MPKECAAEGCKARQGKGPRFSLHAFPKDPKRQLAWAVKVNRAAQNESGKITTTSWMPSDYDVLCSQHFEDSCFTLQTQLTWGTDLEFPPRLLPDAVPTTFRHTADKSKAERSSTVTEKRQRWEMTQVSTKPG